ncbi:hypothetical protein BN6_12350 [Saccharothrix espanaensis DSM 44229]|uniref:Uncharacterized protein n=1 Tax=Saccharothrix espanaensis (strain ATCC 51144 / DSM 44229 / JCM 9112 / NBRC 15066 / NRRL 15764) TaxID=1179773 RepID=K0JRZ0_SACES|nr:hypothetical protein BN6_12350 [Saccharothrix espanaensis DSM 44229]
MIVDQLVAIEPPRIFAVVQEYGERLNAWVIAWGMAFEDHAEVYTVDQRTRLSLSRPDSAPALFASERESLSARRRLGSGWGRRGRKSATCSGSVRRGLVEGWSVMVGGAEWTDEERRVLGAGFAELLGRVDELSARLSRIEDHLASDRKAQPQPPKRAC